MNNNLVIVTFEFLKNVSLFFISAFYSPELANIIQKICVIKQAFSVKITGYWPSSLLHFIYRDQIKDFKYFLREQLLNSTVVGSEKW